MQSITVYDKRITSTDTEFGEICNFISGSSSSLKYTKIQTSWDEGNVHGNGLGVGFPKWWVFCYDEQLFTKIRHLAKDEWELRNFYIP